MALNDPALIKNDKRIDWVLSRPDISAWLKEALMKARDRDPVDVLNDLEVLSYLLRARSDTRIHLMLGEMQKTQEGKTDSRH